jgi:hypothetical protein
MAGKRWRFTFRRWLDESAQNQLRQMRDILTTCALGQQKDKPIWIWEAKRKFSVKSMLTYVVLMLKNLIKICGKPKYH